MSGLWRIRARVPAAAALAISEALEPFTQSVSLFEIEDGGDWDIQAISHGAPDRGPIVAAVAVVASLLGADAPDLMVEPLAPTDWLADNRASFPPMQIGRFHIHGSHVKTGARAGHIGLRIDAAAAFGSGSHATTAGCLKAIEQLAKRGPVRRILDIGCGTAILAMAAAKSWPRATVLAADIDAVAVRTAQGNIAGNGLSARIRTLVSRGYGNPAVRRAGRFDLILANILPVPLCRMAPQAAAQLGPGGRIVLSGLMQEDERTVIAAHRAQGLALQWRHRSDPWSTLIMRRPG